MKYLKIILNHIQEIWKNTDIVIDWITVFEYIDGST